MKNIVFLILCVSVCLSLSCTAEKSLLKDPKYSEDKDLIIQTSDTISISGNLSYAGPKYLAIMIAGSGPTDRNCNSIVGLKTDAFLQLALKLKNEGISSFRYDKRGIGSSTKVSEVNMVIQDLIEDVNQIVGFFSADFDAIIVIGHSEGALIGSTVSYNNEHVSSFISLCGISTTLDKVVEDQLSKYPMLLDLAKVHIEEIKNNKKLSEVNPMLVALFRESVVPYLKSVFDLDPIEEIKKIDKPVLIIGGECDSQVPTLHAKELNLAHSKSHLV